MFLPLLGQSQAAPAEPEQRAEMRIPKLTGRSLNKCVSWGRTALFWLSASLLGRTHPGPSGRAGLGPGQTLRPLTATKHAEETTPRPHGPVTAVPGCLSVLTLSHTHCDTALEASKRGPSMCPGQMDREGWDSCSARPFSWLNTKARLTGAATPGPTPRDKQPEGPPCPSRS